MTHPPQPLILEVHLKPAGGVPGNRVEIHTLDLWWKEAVAELREFGVYWEVGRTNGDILMSWVPPELINKITTTIHNGGPHV